jgi:acyl-coenzyme A synthetase/AMP-(fatty) acid ligase
MENFWKAEERFKKHAAVEMCALIGAGESESGVNTTVTLVVQKSEDYAEKPNDILMDELMAYARDILSSRQVPEKIEFVDVIPLAPDGKIDRKALQTKFA